MLSDYTFSELISIFVMQGFAGLSLFSVFLLMALGLAVIFGQMGVINMAHGEFMIMGAYTTYVTSHIFQNYLPDLFSIYFFVAVVISFIVAGALGALVEWSIIRFLYSRPLDTLLATWGLSLIFQQVLRSIFGAKEVTVILPDWMMGALEVADGIEIPINGLIVLILTVLVTVFLWGVMFRSKLGISLRAVVLNRPMAGAVGINTALVDRITFAFGCGIAGIAGCAFTMIGSTGPTSGSLYIVDTFLVVVFGGAGTLIGTICSAFGIAQAQSVLEFFMSGSMAKVITLLIVVGILMLRPQGLFAMKLRK